MDGLTSSSDESKFNLERIYSSEKDTSMKIRKNRKLQSNSQKRFKNISDYRWIRKAEESPYQIASATNSQHSSKPIEFDSSSANVEVSEKNVMKQLDGQENSSENDELTHCDCTICEEGRFAEYQASRIRPRLKSCEAKTDITNESKEKFISTHNISKPKVGNVIDRTVTKRLASANRDTINSLRGQINCLEIKIKELQKENGTYKLLQYRQDKALTRYQGEFAELPNLIKNHKEELQGCRQLLRKAENKCRDLEETIKVRDKRIGKLQDENYKLGTFVNQYDMGNRYKLLTQLKDTKAKLRDTEKRAEESSHHLEVLHKSQQIHTRQDSVRIRQAEENLHKAHMRNLELRKYIEDQGDRLKTYECLLVKTIRKNNLPIAMDDLRNENANRPKTYTLPQEKNANLAICEKVDEPLQQEHPIRQYSVTNKGTLSSHNSQSFCQPQKIDRNTSPFIMESSESFTKVGNFEDDDEDEEPTEILFAYCMRDSESSQCPTDNCLPEGGKVLRRNNEMDHHDEQEHPIQILHSGKSGGDQENLVKSVSKQENNSRKNRYDAGDEAESNSVCYDDCTFIDGGEGVEGNHSNLCTQEHYVPDEENYFEDLPDTTEIENYRNSKKLLQKCNNEQEKHPFFKISEEYIEKYFVGGQGRNKKSLAIMKKRKNAIFHPLPMHVESLPSGNSSSRSKIIQLNHNGEELFIPFMEAFVSPAASNDAGIGNQFSSLSTDYEYCQPDSDHNTEYGRTTKKAFLSQSR